MKKILFIALVALSVLSCNKRKPLKNQTCSDAGGSSNVAEPQLVMNLSIGNTGWFSSPIAYDLTGDGKKEIIAPFYNVAVWTSDGRLLQEIERGDYHEGRVYAPSVLADLEGDGIIELVVAAGRGTVAAYEWREGSFSIKAGWSGATSCIGESCFENRSLGADDLDGDGTIEIVVSSTRSESPDGYEGTNPHVFVFEPDGSLRNGWPRYDTRTGSGRDIPGGEDSNCYGHSGFGSYGLNIGIGDIDDDDDKEILVTYDNHHIQAFNPDGTTLLTDPSYFTRRSGDCRDEPMSWGQFIRYLDPEVEENHYHLHQGDWPGPSWTMWLQWTHSPPGVGDINGDGLNEVIGIPNAEQNEPYHTYHYAFMVLEGDYEANGHRSGRRLPGWEALPLSEEPLYNDDWYPPGGVPSPTIANIQGDSRPEILAAISDGCVYAFAPDASLLWRYDFTMNKPLMYASEVAVADLSRDGRPEIIFCTYGEDVGDGHLFILGSNGELLHRIKLENQRRDVNGIGGAACPTISDVDGDGTLEILITTIDHGLDVYRVPQSGDNCMLWPTGRGNYLRNGRQE